MLIKAVNRQIPGYTKGSEDSWCGSYTFIHGSDPQFGFIDLIKGGGGKKWDTEIKLLKDAISAINKMSPRPKFFFICGDLIDAYPGVEPTNSEQTKDMIKILSECEIPIFVISGNHDIGNKPTTSSIEQYTEQYGDDFYSFYAGGVFYIALNSQYFYEPDELPQLANEQMIWLDEQLQEAKSNQDITHTVVFMHIPLFISDPDEKNQYFSIPQPLRSTLLEKFADAGVSIVFSGHYHRNAGGFWKKEIDGKMKQIECVVTSAIGAQLGKDKSGLSVVKVSQQSIQQKYYAIEDIPLTN
ncbi:serine/threonine-protein phosphatase CPPED1-like [Styela clava]